MRINWKTITVKLKELTPLEHNPFGKITDVKKDRLRHKLKKLGVFEIPAINFNYELLTFNKRYHILHELYGGDYEIDVRIPDRLLSESERSDVIFASNIHEGEWVQEVITEMYSDVDLEEIGLDFTGLDEIVQDQDEMLEDMMGSEPVDGEMPITPKFSEKYDAFIIVADNEIDATHVAELLGVVNTKCYKSQHIGRSYVVRAYEFLEKLKSKA